MFGTVFEGASSAIVVLESRAERAAAALRDSGSRGWGGSSSGSVEGLVVGLVEGSGEEDIFEWAFGEILGVGLKKGWGVARVLCRRRWFWCGGVDVFSR